MPKTNEANTTASTWIDEDRYLTEAESFQNAQLVANHFAGRWSPEAISAMIGNMRAESTVNPNLYERGFDWEDDRGFGLVQWTPRSKYWDWAVANNLPPRDGDSQLMRLQYEIDNNIQWIPVAPYNMSFVEFSVSKQSVDYLTRAFTWSYERPNQEAGESSMPARIAFAEYCFNNLDFSGSGVVHFIWPTGTKNVTSGFRPPHRPDHHGIDIADGTVYNVWASADGIVTQSYYSDSYGEVVFILHEIDGQEWETVYAHLETGTRTVSVGDTVTKGQVLGVMGNTGASQGLHLHFELHKGRWNEAKSNAVDPMFYLDVATPDPDPEPPLNYYVISRHNTNMRRMGVRGRR